jgi:16S rRNA A1518/A1519 N6-dimethyltransferase RsmA/KsgA/DIM1 with predicted DNA glycosylase/AP lyase activity
MPPNVNSAMVVSKEKKEEEGKKRKKKKRRTLCWYRAEKKRIEIRRICIYLPVKEAENPCAHYKGKERARNFSVMRGESDG